ncbi:twin arginine translocase protein A [Novipirellula aureliae]|uniref:Sec-independent protein translocase protein TatA n=1 Tax=Novipirellula aureliae TaxID=2527966 RepID=A0A5C6DUN7_9BACT|nr:twin-arginine translocase TatA/TatE family subunit [Novipirellula aureliae]TWU39141.1 twin arginine translocase protein A [Novipirellula aureliae]
MILLTSVLGFISPGPMELAIILAIMLLLFGGQKLPSLMRNLGKSANEFKRGMSESLEDDDSSDSKNEKAS